MTNLQLEHISFITFFIVLASGMLTSLTPCVYPVIPIVVGYLGSLSGSGKLRFKAAVAYALGISVVYTILGLIAALTGSMFGDMTSNPWVYLGFGILLLVMGGNMMDWYIVPLPGFTKKQAPKNAFLFGITSGLVASPCTAPVLGSLLFYVAEKRAVVTGASLLFTFSVGMNLILMLIGFSSSFITKLPKSGKWMVIIKKVLAMLIIASGIYFVFRAGTLY